MRPTQEAIERFYNYVPSMSDDACWEWLGGRSSSGYGASNFNGRRLDAHRLSFLIHYGELPDGKHICHRCDNKLCVNPKHLFSGTRSDNMRDAFAKGRGSPPPRPLTSPPKPRPSRKKPNPNKTPGAKITPAIAREIKSRLVAGETGRSIASLYGIHFGTVSDIKLGKIWRDI